MAIRERTEAGLSSAHEHERVTTFKMRDVARLTNLPPSTIHFYIRAGLVPQPEKTSQNQATYEQEFVDRVRLIKLLQERAHLPLSDIRETLAKLSAESVRRVPQRIEAITRQAIEAMHDRVDHGSSELVTAVSLEREQVSRADLEQLIDAQMISAVYDEDDVLRLSPLDGRIAVAFARVRDRWGGSMEAMMPILAVYVTHVKPMAKMEAAQIARVLLEAGSDESAARAADHGYMQLVTTARDEFVYALHRKELAQALSDLVEH